MGDRIASMNSGRIVQVDTPLAVYASPADMFVGGFIGTPPMNFLDADVSANGGVPRVRIGDASFALPEGAPAGSRVVLGIRAEAIAVEQEPRDGAIRATVVVVEPLGSHNLLTVRVGESMLKVSARPDVFPAPDSDVWLRLEPDRIRWMDPETRTALRRRAGDPTAVAT